MTATITMRVCLSSQRVVERSIQFDDLVPMEERRKLFRAASSFLSADVEARVAPIPRRDAFEEAATEIAAGLARFGRGAGRVRLIRTPGR